MKDEAGNERSTLKHAKTLHFMNKCKQNMYIFQDLQRSCFVRDTTSMVGEMRRTFIVCRISSQINFK